MSLVIPVEELFNDDNRIGLTSKHISWSVIPLHLAAKIQNGYPYDSKKFNSLGIGKPLVRIRDIKGGKRDTFYDGEYSDDFIIKKGDLLIGMDGDFNSALWDGEIALLNQRVCRLFPDENILVKKFVYYTIEGYLSLINQNTSSTTVKHLSSRDILKIPFPLPPLAEQNRIVKKLDKLFASIEIVNTKLDAIPQLLKEFKQNLLSQIANGQITYAYETGNSKNEAYEGFLLGDLILKIQAGKSFSCPEMSVTKDTVGLVKISAVTWGEFNYQETKTVINKNLINSKLFIKQGDFLISRANTLELVGASVIVKEIDYDIMLSDKVWRVVFDEKIVNPKFVNFFLKSKTGRVEIESRATGNQLSMRNLSQVAFKEIPISIPSLEEQNKIISHVESLFAKADEIKSQYKNLKEKIDALPQAILAKAFKGELVPQDPNDESASELLKRIKEVQSLSSKLGKLKQQSEISF